MGCVANFLFCFVLGLRFLETQIDQVKLQAVRNDDQNNRRSTVWLKDAAVFPSNIALLSPILPDIMSHQSPS